MRGVTVKLDRLRQMSPTEIAYRSRQQASKWIDRLTTPAPSDDADGGWRAGGGGPATTTAALGRALTTRFFAGAAAESTPATIARRAADHQRAIVAQADRLIDGRIDLLGYRDLALGSPIDWDRDLVSGRRAPRAHWSRIDPLDPAGVGDSKVIWELNRHQWMVTLAQAGRLTGDGRYGQHALTAIEGWRRAHPYGHGVNWSSSLEVAFRLIAWSWFFAVSDGLDRAGLADLEALVASMRVHAQHVERYLSVYFSPNTHLTGEALGLYYAGVLLADEPRAAAWRALGASILQREIERQVSEDGVYCEQATCYQRYTAEIYLHYLILADRAGDVVPDLVRACVERVIDFLVAINQPSGAMPAIGDADGGWVLPLTPRGPGDCRGVLAIAAAWFKRADYAWAAGGLQPEVVWMLGDRGVQAFDALLPAPPAAKPSRLYSDGGYGVMRSGWGPDARRLIFDTGPLWQGACRAHGHADLLSIQCAAFGEEFLVDPGTYCYTPEPVWREHFRSTRAHNTVLVDGENQAEPRGPFGWRAPARTDVRDWQSSPDADYADAEHSAYERLPDPVRHRRRVLFVKPHYWVVVDDVAGRARHVVDVRFQFAHPVAEQAGGWLAARGKLGELWLKSFSAKPLQLQLPCGETDPIDGWVSDDYGRRRPAPIAIHRADVVLPLRVVTVIIPNAAGVTPPTAVTPLIGAHGDLTGLRFDDFRSLVRIEDGSMTREEI